MPRAACLLLLLAATVSAADDRHGVALDAKAFPQSTPKEALDSVNKAVAAKKYDYLVAHLADPAFVDDRVKRVYAGKFDEQVADTKARLDPSLVKQLARFAKDGKWTLEKTSAVVTLPDVRDRCVRLKLEGGRWFLLHRFDNPLP